MALPNSGPISFSEMRENFGGGTGPISFSDLYRGGSRVLNSSGEIVPIVNKAQSVPEAGAISFADFHGTEAAFEYTHAGSGDIIYSSSSVFGSVNYASSWLKRLIIEGTQRRVYIDVGNGGQVHLINNGEIQGYHANRNGGNGYPALYNFGTDVHLWNNGAIRGAGGGGGQGGTGGAGGGGFYQYTTREPTSGEYYDFRATHAMTREDSFQWEFRWSWSVVASGKFGFPSSVSSGGYTYYRGTLRQSSNVGPVQDPVWMRHYAIYRTRLHTAYTSGGSGGAGGFGGYGQGYHVAAEVGAAGSWGSSPGTNAGWGGRGGTGGTGGSWGINGNPGAPGGTGSSGNHSGGAGGSPGSPGGTAGAGISGTRPTIHVAGTIQGTY